MLKKLVRVSAKYTFRQLRNRAPLYCKCLNCDVLITRKFFRHIDNGEKRTNKEIIDRLLIIPLIEDILLNGKVVEERIKLGKQYFRINFKVANFIFSVILIQEDIKYILLSCFIYKEKFHLHPNKKRLVSSSS